jgi:hypothetical protein
MLERISGRRLSIANHSKPQKWMRYPNGQIGIEYQVAFYVLTLLFMAVIIVTIRKG